MTVTNVGAIYAINSKMLQRIYIPDSDDSEIDAAYVGYGETLVKVPIEVFRSGDHMVIQNYIGKPSHDGVCVVVDKNSKLVIDRIFADPEIYNNGSGLTSQGHRLIKHSTAAHGDRWEGDHFSREFAEVHHQTAEVVSITRQNIDKAAPSDPKNFHFSRPNNEPVFIAAWKFGTR